MLIGFGLVAFTPQPAQSGRLAGVVFRGHRHVFAPRWRRAVRPTEQNWKPKQNSNEKRIFQTLSALAGGTGGLHGLGFCMKPDSPAKSGSLVKLKSRERKAAFGLAVTVGERVGERTEQKAEWSGGGLISAREHPEGERKSAGFQGVVCKGN